MKDEKAPTSPGGFGPDYVGWAVPVTATAYMMANSYEEAELKVSVGLRKQQRVMLTKLVTHQPVPADAPEAVENIPPADLKVVGGITNLEGGEAVAFVAPVPATPPCTFCDAHRRDIQRKVACTLGQVCHAEYWRTRLGSK